MNQILATEIYKDDNKKSNGKGIDIKKIIVFFACVILIFGVVIIGINVYKIIGRNGDNGSVKKPDLKIGQVGEQIRIVAEYEQGIEKIVYYWDESDKQEIVQNGRTKIEKTIDIPAGQNTLVVQLVGTDGEKTQISESFVGKEVIESEIKIEFVANEYKLKVTATNDSGLKYITYKWNDGEEVTIDAEDEESTEIETIVDIDRLGIGRGENEIIVTAVDNSNNETIESKTIEGRYEPEIEMIQYGGTVECKVTHDMGFQKIEISINGNVFVYDENSQIYDETLTKFECPIPLEEGENIVIVVAYSLEGTTKSMGVRAEYNP